MSALFQERYSDLSGTNRVTSSLTLPFIHTYVGLGKGEKRPHDQTFNIVVVVKISQFLLARHCLVKSSEDFLCKDEHRIALM